MVTCNLIANADISKIKAMATPFQGSKLYMPTDGKLHPGVIMLHGSEGGSLAQYKIEAEFLASHGYVVLAFCWYNCSKNPISSPYSSLENIELRKTIDAIKWLKNTKEVNGSKIALAGWSRGAEQAVLLGTIKEAIDMVDSIAVHAPSDTVVGGFNWSALDQRCWICASFDLSCFNNSKDLNQWNWDNIHWNPSCGEYPKFFKNMNQETKESFNFSHFDIDVLRTSVSPSSFITFIISKRLFLELYNIIIIVPTKTKDICSSVKSKSPFLK